MVEQKQGLWVFKLIRPRARRVYLVGDFNGWSQTTIQMHRNPEGLWETSLALQPGVYRFRYFADGQWLTDYASYGVERNEAGEYDSVLYVPVDASRPSRSRLRFPSEAGAVSPSALAAPGA